MSRRLVILTEIIAPYRIPVFNALAEHPEIDLHVVFLAETDPTERQWLVYKGEIKFSYEVLPSWRRRINGHNLLLNRQVSCALRKYCPDVILCGGYNYLASWQSILWAKRNGKQFYIWIESTAQDRRNRSRATKFLKTKFIEHCDAVVVPGASSFQYAKSFGVPHEKIFVAPNAVDIHLFARQSEVARKNDEALRQKYELPSCFFLFAGRLVPEKGVFDLVEAYGKLAPQLRKEIGLVFAGDGVLRRDLEREAALCSPGEVCFTGFVQREELAACYGLATAFVFPTHSDPWGLVVNEAMASGLPVIVSSAAGCAADLVENRWNGFVVSPGNVEQLMGAMRELAADSDLRATMGKRSWERIQQYSPTRCADGIANAVLSRNVACVQSVVQ